MNLRPAPQQLDFEDEASYWKAMYDHREEETHLLSEEVIRLKRILNDLYGYTEKPKEPTAEEKAIRLFLSKDHPHSNPCGCMGPQLKYHSGPASCGWPKDEWEEIVVRDLGKDKLKSVQQLRRDFDLPIQRARSIIDSNTFRFKSLHINRKTVKVLRELGCEVEVWANTDRQPVCPCEMQWVVEVDNHYYRIHEHRSPGGVTHTAEDLGHVAGPFKVA